MCYRMIFPPYMFLPSPQEKKCNFLTQVVVLNIISLYIHYISTWYVSPNKREKCILLPQIDTHVLRTKWHIGRDREQVGAPTAWGGRPLALLTVCRHITFSVNLTRSRVTAVRHWAMIFRSSTTHSLTSICFHSSFRSSQQTMTFHPKVILWPEFSCGIWT